MHLLCYCLLSNHVHLLLETLLGNLSKLMQPLQTSYTLYFNRRHRHMGHVFAQRYKALVVDRDNHLLQVSRYIHLNPVGAKLAQRPQDYRWSSYRAYLKGKKRRGGAPSPHHWASLRGRHPRRYGGIGNLSKAR